MPRLQISVGDEAGFGFGFSFVKPCFYIARFGFVSFSAAGFAFGIGFALFLVTVLGFVSLRRLTILLPRCHESIEPMQLTEQTSMLVFILVLAY